MAAAIIPEIKSHIEQTLWLHYYQKFLDDNTNVNNYNLISDAATYADKVLAFFKDRNKYNEEELDL